MPTPNIIVLDCETTGTDRAADRVIEVCIQRGLDGADARTWRIKPPVPIHPDAQAAHGITLEQLALSPVFFEVADELLRELADVDVIIGYNVAFDLEMLAAEFGRVNRALDISQKKIVDAYRLWQQCEPRNLQAAHRRFLGEEFAHAHSATADVAATGRVLAKMLGAFALNDEDWDAIAKRADPEHGTWIGPTRHLRWSHGVVTISFGKYAGVPLHELAAGPNRAFLQWVLGKDFPAHVKQVFNAALIHKRDEFLAWVAQRFPPPAKEAA